MAKHDIRQWSSQLSAEERTESARQAGYASGEARRTHRAFRQILREMLALDLDDADAAADALKQLGMRPNRENALMLSALVKAQSGDVEALRFVRDTLGEKPTDSYNVQMLDKPIKAMDLSALSDEELERLADQTD